MGNGNLARAGVLAVCRCTSPLAISLAMGLMGTNSVPESYNRLFVSGTESLEKKVNERRHFR